eukprot:3372099-Prymnesium_polylepis.1
MVTPATGPAASTTTSHVQVWSCEERARAPRTASWGTCGVGYRFLGGSGMVCRVVGQLRRMHEAAPATVSCRASTLYTRCTPHVTHVVATRSTRCSTCKAPATDVVRGQGIYGARPRGAAVDGPFNHTSGLGWVAAQTG